MVWALQSSCWSIDNRALKLSVTLLSMVGANRVTCMCALHCENYDSGVDAWKSEVDPK